MDDSLCIVFYIVLWAASFILYWRKKRIIDAGGIIIVSYLSFAVLSFFLYINYYKDDEIRELKLFPFVYLFSMLLIFMQPVLRFEGKCEIQQPSMSLIYRICIVFLVASAVVIPFVLNDLADAIIVILTTDEGGDELHYLSSLERGKDTSFALYNIFAIVFNVFSDFAILMFFYCLTLKHTKKIIVIGLLFALIVSMLRSIVAGGRTGITMTLLISITTYFLLRHHFPSKIKKLVSYIGIGFVLFVASLLITIGESRFSSNAYGADYQLLNYTGQAPLYFNKYGLDAGGIRYGDRTCCIFKKILLFDNVPTDFEDCRQKYRKMKLDDSRFITFVGDFTLDFGPIITTILFCLTSFFIVKHTKSKNNTILFHQLILIYLFMSISITGGMYLFYYSFKGNYSLIGFIIMYFLFKWDYINHYKSNIKAMK